MDLIDDEQQNKSKNKFKGVMISISVAIVILIGISIVLLVMIDNIQRSTLKLTIDGVPISSFSNDLFIFENNKLYVAIKDFATMNGYKAYNGDQEHLEEDVKKCYIDNDFEQASFELNSNIIHKTNTDSEYFTIEDPVIMKNNKLYVEIKGMQIGANCVISYNSSNNQVVINTLPYLIAYYGNMYPNSVVMKKEATFNNQKALLYNMVVVMNENKKYGVISTDGKEIIGTKYANIEFIEGSENFIVKTEQGKMGIVTNKGNTKIEAIYDNIKQIDKDLKLYLVKSNQKQGVLNDNGNTVIYLEYDTIGINTSDYQSNDIKNQYILFNKCIPVERDHKWGIFDINGNEILPVEYDGLGCTKTTGANNLLIIPEYEGIVILKGNRYGLINADGKELIQCVLDRFYSVTKSGIDTYYMTQGENTYNVIDYIKQFVFPQTETEENNNNTSENTTSEENEQETNTTNDTEDEQTDTENEQSA